jgi:hypothetical protein
LSAQHLLVRHTVWLSLHARIGHTIQLSLAARIGHTVWLSLAPRIIVIVDLLHSFWAAHGYKTGINLVLNENSKIQLQPSLFRSYSLLPSHYYSTHFHFFTREQDRCVHSSAQHLLIIVVIVDLLPSFWAAQRYKTGIKLVLNENLKIQLQPSLFRSYSLLPGKSLFTREQDRSVRSSAQHLLVGHNVRLSLATRINVVVVDLLPSFWAGHGCKMGIELVLT